MSRERLANAFDKAAEAMAELALELRASDSPSREAAAPVAESAHSAPAARAAGAVPPAPAASAFTECPKHNKAFTPSKNPEWPAYCSQVTDDPAWGKPKTDRDGNPVMYCRITSKNAGEWAAVHGMAA